MLLSETSHRQPPTRVTSLITFSASRLAFLMALLLALGFLRRSFALRPFVLTMWLLLTLDRSLRLLPLMLGWWTALLRRRLDGGPLNFSASLLRRLSARGRCGALLEGRWRAGTALGLRRGNSFLRRSLPSLRRRGRRTLLRLIVLLHYGFARLVTVILALKHLLLLEARISIR